MILSIDSDKREINHIHDLPKLEGAAKNFKNQIISVLNQWYEYGSLSVATSGSTGIPKVITLPQELLLWSVHQSCKSLQLGREKVLMCLSPEKVGGAMMLLRSVIQNWEIHCQEASANPMLNVNENHDYTFVSLVPYQLSTILEDRTSLNKLSRFSVVLIGGASIPLVLENRLQEFASGHGPSFFHSYGMTETASHVALRRLSTNTVNTFTLFEGVGATLDKRGCGVFAIPALNMEVTTNDILKLDEDKIEYLGRVDDVINSGGVKISLFQITRDMEKLASGIDALSFLFCAETDEKWGESLSLIVNQEDVVEQLLILIRSQFPVTHQPKRVYYSNEFRRNVSGKIDAQATLAASVKIRG